MLNPNASKAIFFIAASVICFWASVFYNKESRIAKQSNEEILKTLDSEIHKFHDESNIEFDKFKLYANSKDKIVFSDLNKEFNIDVTIFEEEKPGFWTSNSQIFDFDQVSKNFRIKIIKTNTTSLVVFKNTVKIEDKVYVLIHQLVLSRRYSINNAFLKSGLNRSLFPEKVVRISLNQSASNVFFDKIFLFSVDFEEKTEQANLQETIILTVLIVAFILFFILGISFLLRFLIELKKQILAWILLVLVNSVTIAILFFFKFEISQLLVFQWLDFGLVFNLIISISISTLLFLPFRYFLTNSKKKSKLDFSKRYFWLVDIGVLILNAIALQSLYLTAKYWYIHPFYSFNIFNIGLNSSEKTITLLILLLNSLCYFMFSHLISQYLMRRRSKLTGSASWLWGIFALAIILGFVFLFEFNLIVLFLSFLFVSVSVWQGWPNTLLRPRYITYLYLFFCIVIVSVSISIAGYLGEKELLANKSKKWAEKINLEAGVIDFYKLKTLTDSLKQDTLVNQGLDGKVSDLQVVEQVVLKNYVSKGFEEYECNVFLFDNEGTCINKNIKNYFFYYSNYSKPKFRTQFKGIFKVQSYSSNYYCFIPFYSNSFLKGYVILEFRLRRLIPNSILPALFKERISTSDYNDSKPDFAIFKNGILVSESGNLNLQKQLPTMLATKNKSILKGEFDLDNYLQKFDFEDGKSILISFQVSILKILVSNFSFLFAIFSGVLAIFIFSNTFYYKVRQVSTTFTTKIQLFINIAFFLPLVAVSVTSFSIMNTVFKADLEKSYNEKASFVSQNLSNIFSRYNQGRISIDEMSLELERASKYVQSDIVLYDVNGKMIVNTQPSLFDFSILSAYISPFAFADIFERKESTAILDEKVGKFQFKTVYSPIKSYDSGVILGFVSIPFFESDIIFKEKVMDSITAILNIFTLIFILFLSITYLFSRQLTLPLVMLTQKMKYTSLERNNEPLIYTASDEIGILVKEYNRMLRKLEDNKKALANTEKESAWREMAKQVAHEIKNPLTPMKLALQNMQRMLKTDRTDKDEIVLRSADVLLEQIENLNEIAGSFSSFAQMPLPKKENYELVKLIENVVFLFQSETDVDIIFKSELEICNTVGDENMMSRIMINLVQNAIESVPEERQPIIQIGLAIWRDQIEIKVKDNGTGIDEALGNKIFQPNFSTKSSGSGIGLALAKRGLEQMGGKIFFSSENNTGTEFTIRLPLI